MAKGTTKKAAKKAVTKKVAAKKVAVKTTAAEAPAKKAVTKKVAVKKAPVKKVAAKKVAAKKAAPKKAAVKKPAKALTTIVARIDVGFGNSLYLRGDASGLSWEKGIVMGCAGSDEWVWSSDDVKGPLEFKVLINDEIWADGANAIVAPGERVVIEPDF